jgi:cytochrome c oxidase assembly protein subunit 15
MQTADCPQHPGKSLSGSQQTWPYRLVWALWGVGLASIAMGHTVTSYSAGMAIPDWPSVFGHFPFLFPLHEWFRHWDVFLAQSHRLIVTILAIFSLILTGFFWKIRWNSHKWVATAVFILICLQAALGASRVLLGDIGVAAIHGCVGPLCFGLITVLLVVASPSYAQLCRSHHEATRRRWRKAVTVALFIAGLTYLQLVLLAQLRHVLPQQPPIQALLIVIGQGILWAVIGMIVVTAAMVLRKPLCNVMTRKLLWLVIGLYCLHLVLGLSAWIVNFNFPAWFLSHVLAVEYTIVQGGVFQVIVSTAFALVSSLLFAASLALLICVAVDRGANVDSDHN